MISIISKPNLTHLNNLVKILPQDWIKFGVEYRSVQKDSQGFVTGGQLQDGRRFKFDQLRKQFTFIPS